MTVQAATVQKEVFEVLNASLKVEFSIEIGSKGVHSPDTEIEIYSVNGVPANFFEEGILELIDEEIKVHASNVRKYSEESRGEAMGDESRGN